MRCRCEGQLQFVVRVSIICYVRGGGREGAAKEGVPRAAKGYIMLGTEQLTALQVSPSLREARGRARAARAVGTPAHVQGGLFGKHGWGAFARARACQQLIRADKPVLSLLSRRLAAAEAGEDGKESGLTSLPSNELPG